MSKAAELAALIANVNKGSSLANKNFIINGGMQVWQRATAATAAVDGAYKTVDRFFNWVSGGGAYTTEQSTGHLATTGHENALKLAVTTADTSIAAGDYYVIGYKIEAQDLQSFKYGSSSANAVTLSFWIRATKAGTHTLFFSKNDSTQYIYVAEYTVSASDTWEHITITILPDSNIKAGAGAIANDNGAGITIGFVLKEGSNYEGATASAWNTSKYTTSNQVNNMDSTSNTWYLTGVQLEIGEKATEFEHEPYETTLSKCHRYFHRWQADTASDSMCTGCMISDTLFLGDYFLKETMRIAPSISHVGTFKVRIKTSDRACGNPSLNRATNQNVQMSLTLDADNNENGFGCFLKASGDDADALVDLDAEL